MLLHDDIWYEGTIWKENILVDFELSWTFAGFQDFQEYQLLKLPVGCVLNQKQNVERSEEKGNTRPSKLGIKKFR